MTNDELKALQAALQAKRLDLIHQLRGRTAQLTVEAGGADPLDQMQSMAVRDETALMISRFSSTLSEIERSRRAISEGCYGFCADCEEPIAVKRLKTIPWAAYCVRCQERLEAEERLGSALPYYMRQAA